MKKLTTLISVVAMMCAVIAALVFSIWAAVYGDSHYRFYKKEYQKYEVTEDLDMNIDHVMYVTEHMMNYLIGKEEKLSVVTTVEGKEQDFFNERDRLHMRDVRNLFLGGIKVGGVCLIVAVAILTMFKRDLKLAKKRGYDLSLLNSVVDTLAMGQPLAEKYKDHSLVGNYKGCRECHITPDWLLIYEISENELILYLTRTGTHSDLF